MPICVERQFPLLCQWSMCVWERICLCEIEGESVLESGRNRKSKKKKERELEKERERERDSWRNDPEWTRKRKRRIDRDKSGICVWWRKNQGKKKKTYGRN